MLSGGVLAFPLRVKYNISMLGSASGTHGAALDLEHIGEKVRQNMTYYDDQLRELQEKISRARQLSAMVEELREQRWALAAKVRELEAAKQDEQAEVDRLEGRSLAAFFYYVIGKKEERLSKERQEAYAARVMYDTAALELDDVEEDLRWCGEELDKLRGSEEQYAAMLREKTAAVKAAGGETAGEILRLEERSAFLESQKKELREAISAGNTARRTAERVLRSLSDAEGLGTWDLLGGGLLADIAKHSHLDDAQSAVEQLQLQLRRFKTELADVRIHADMDGFLRFADYFFDGLFADWAVMSQISQSQSQVQNTLGQVERALSRLESMMRAVEQEQNQIKNEVSALVLEAKL